jgi:dihydrolipoamide dehydrogenase
VNAEKALVAIGFIPNSENIGLEKVGVQIERGAIVTDEQMRTNVPNIYAIGDVTAKLMLAHVASAQGIVAAETIAGRETVKLDYGAIPRCTYCHPQVASMGLTEKQACQQGYQVRISKFPFQANGKALGLGDSAGFVKVLSDAKNSAILGVHMVGPEVTELLPEYVLARNQELTLHEIVRSVHAHPTLSEALAAVAERPSFPGCK